MPNVDLEPVLLFIPDLRQWLLTPACRAALIAIRARRSPGPFMWSVSPRLGANRGVTTARTVDVLGVKACYGSTRLFVGSQEIAGYLPRCLKPSRADEPLSGSLTRALNFPLFFLVAA